MPKSPIYSATFLVDRRSLIGGLACATALVSTTLAANAAAGSVESCLGIADAEAHGVTRSLAQGADIFVG
jgi:hypothetical protein